MDSETTLAETLREDNRNRPVNFNINCVNGDVITFTGRPCELSAFSHVPQTRKHQAVERSIYNTKSTKHQEDLTDYDRLYKVNYNFDDKVHRCDRRHGTQTTGRLLYLDPWQEEIKKVIPTRSTGEYGKKQVDVINNNPVQVKYKNVLDPPDRKCTRIAIVQTEFYNRNGINALKQRHENAV